MRGLTKFLPDELEGDKSVDHTEAVRRLLTAADVIHSICDGFEKSLPRSSASALSSLNHATSTYFDDEL